MKYILVMLLISSISIASNFNYSKSYSITTYSSLRQSRLDCNLPLSGNGSNQEFSHGNAKFALSVSVGNNDRLGNPSIHRPCVSQETAFLLKLRDLQKNGNKLGLQQEIKQLEQKWLMIGRRSKIDLVNSILQEPITDIFATIKNGSLEQAQEAIQRLMTLSPYKYRDITYENQDIFARKQAHYQQKYMFDVLQEAKRLYESRESSPPIYGCPIPIGYYTQDEFPFSADFNQKEHASDFVATLPSNTIHISPEVDAAVTHSFDQIDVSELKHIHQLSEEAGATLFDIIHQTVSTDNCQHTERSEALAKLHMIATQVEQKDVPYFCMRCAIAFKDRITDPVGIVVDQAKGVYALAKYVCDLNFGRYYMTDREAIEHLESSINSFVAITDGLKNLTLEQVTDVTGVLAADITFTFGVSKGLSYLKEIGALNKANQAVVRTVETLEKALVPEGEHKVVTPEGITAKATGDPKANFSPVKDVPKKVGGASFTQPTSHPEIRQAIINRARKIVPDDLEKLGFIGEFNQLDYYNKLTGEISLNTELSGGTARAQRVFNQVKTKFESSRKLIKKDTQFANNGAERIFYKFADGSSVQIRASGKSGHPKVDIVDISKNIKEKNYVQIRDIAMEEPIKIVANNICIDIEELRKIIIAEWQSGELYKLNYNQGNRGEILYSLILDDLGDHMDGIRYTLNEKAQKELRRPNANLDWYYDKYPKSDVRSIGFEVYEKLSKGLGDPIESLTTDDIPIILEFLNTPPDKSLEAWGKWENYWNNLDYEERRKKLLQNAEK